MSKNPTDAYDAEGKTVMGQIEDPTAQTGLLTRGQQIVANYEADQIAEPFELARDIDAAIADAFFAGMNHEKRDGPCQHCYKGSGWVLLSRTYGQTEIDRVEHWRACAACNAEAHI